MYRLYLNGEERGLSRGDTPQKSIIMFLRRDIQGACVEPDGTLVLEAKDNVPFSTFEASPAERPSIRLEVPVRIEEP